MPLIEITLKRKLMMK